MCKIMCCGIFAMLLFPALHFILGLRNKARYLMPEILLFSRQSNV